METNYDVVVIGAGSAGLTAAVGFAKVGRRVLLVEREHLGGECTNSGCIPSKALLHAAKTGMNSTDAYAYTRSVVESILEEETPEVFIHQGIDVVRGEASFVSKCAVKVAETTYTYKKAIIATGSSPRLLDIAGLPEEKMLTNQNLFRLTTAPEKLLIVGGGPIGLEMAEAFARLGTAVTLLERSDTFVAHEDVAIRPILRQHLEALGVTIHTDVTLARVEDERAVIETVTDGTEVERAPFDQVLVAIGRLPNLPQGLAAAGIKYDEQGIIIDSQYRTQNRHVYAIGDVSLTNKFTHTADDAARQVVAHVVSRGWWRANQQKSIPKVTYTEPEVAQVGLSPEAAVEQYGPDRIRRIEVPFTENDRAKTDDVTTGVLVVTVRRVSGRILGAHLIGPRAGEIIAIFSLAIDHRLSLWKLQQHIFPYPTYSLIVKKAGDQFVAEQLANVKTDVLASLMRQAPKLIAGVIWLSALFALARYQATSGLSSTDIAIQLFDFLSVTIWGPLLYVLFYAVRPVTFFPATVLTILAGIFFGLWWGIALTLVAATLSAIVAYWVGRFFGADLALSQSVIGTWVKRLKQNTFAAILTARLVFLPFDVVSYTAGVLRAQFIPFALATFLGIILGTSTFVSIGAAIDVATLRQNGVSFSILQPSYLLLSAGIFIGSLALSKLLTRARRRRDGLDTRERE